MAPIRILLKFFNKIRGAKYWALNHQAVRRCPIGAVKYEVFRISGAVNELSEIPSQDLKIISFRWRASRSVYWKCAAIVFRRI